MVDDSRIFIGMYAFPGVVVQLDKRTLQQRAQLRLHRGENDLRWIESNIDHPFLYTDTNTRPARIVRIAKQGMTRHGALTLLPGEDNVLCGSLWIAPAQNNGAASEPLSLMVGTNTSPGRVVKVHVGKQRVMWADAWRAGAGPMRRVASVVLRPHEAHVVAVVTDASHVYAATYTSPARIIKLRGSDLSRVAAMTLHGHGASKITSLVHTHSLLFAGTDTSPGSVFRIEGYTDGPAAVPRLPRAGGGASRATADEHSAKHAQGR